MASPSPTPNIDGTIRATAEYAVAFDLEVWKAQQQHRYEAQLRQAKERLERRLRKEMRDAEKKKMDELEHIRQELEVMGQRLQAAGETLDRRSGELDKREAAFNAKRVKVAEQHENYIARAEEQTRRVREDSQLAQSSLQARLQESERTILQLQEKLSAAQQEYDLLRRRAARYLSEQTDGDDHRVREQEYALSLAQAQLAELQFQQRERSADLTRLAESKADVEQQLSEAKRQLSIVTHKYQRLSEQSQAREWERLRSEQDALEAAKRSHVLRTWAPAVPYAGSKTSSANSAQPTAMSTLRISRPLRERDTFYEMLDDLKREVQAGLAAAQRSSQPHPPSFTIVERPVNVTSHKTSFVSASPNPPSATRTVDLVSDTTAPSPIASPSLPHQKDNVEESLVSGVSEIERPTSAPLPTSAQGARPQQSTVIDMGDTSMESAYPTADIHSWPSVMTGTDEAGIAPLPPARASTLPPLAPAQRGVVEGPSGASVSPHHLSPTPEEFVLAGEAPPEDTTGATKSARDRRDMRAFVQQLQLNREKLLETGVYSEEDRVVKEMGEKIRMYEQYLAQSQ